MSNEDTARAFYDSARSEIISRIGYRDNVLLLYLVAVGAIYGMSFSPGISIQVLLIVPYLALGAAIILSQHHEVISQIGTYLQIELHPTLETIHGENCPTQWDTSETLSSYHKRSTTYRYVGPLLLIVAPAIPSTFITKELAVDYLALKGIIWWAGLLFTLLSIFVITRAHGLRKTDIAKRLAA